MQPDPKRLPLLELSTITVLLVLFNIPLLHGEIADAFVLYPQSLSAGSWHVLLLHAFVHVSPYHLFLDASAFLCLYASMNFARPAQRAAISVGAILGSAAASIFAWAPIRETGLCGLSGAAHGLMAVCAMAMAADPARTRAERIAGCILFLLVALKGAAEALTGSVVFAGLHPGAVGLPVAVCHAGGILGAASVFAVSRIKRRPIAWNVLPAENTIATVA